MLHFSNPFPLSVSPGHHPQAMPRNHSPPAPSLLPQHCALTFLFWEQHAPLSFHHLTALQCQRRGSPAGAALHPAPLPASSCRHQPSLVAAVVSSPPVPGRSVHNCPVQSASKCQLHPVKEGLGPQEGQPVHHSAGSEGGRSFKAG